MNAPYFEVEDALMAEARRFDGTWNAQIGFEYQDAPQESSKRALDARARPSPFDAEYHALVREVEALNPDIVGVCIAAVQQLVPTLQLCTQLRDAGYSGYIVLGGNTVSRLAEEMSKEGLFAIVDGLVTFQGELPLLSICRAIERNIPFDSVPNLIWNDRGTIRRNKSCSMTLDKLPAPDYADLPVGEYAGINFLNVVGARGCYYGKCTFCAIPYGWGEGGYAGARSADLVFDDMATLASRHGLNRFKFVDEALSPSFMRDLSRRICAEAAPFEWEGYVRLERAWSDPEFVRTIALGGFKKGYFGLEIMNSETRASLSKNDSVRPELLLKLCATNDVKVHLFCMFGFPGTNEVDARRTAEFILRNADIIDTADIFPWTLAKHTSVAGVEPIVEPDHDWQLEFDHFPTRPGVLTSAAVRDLAERCEDEIWEEAPRLLHPIHRMLSPWDSAIRGQERVMSEGTYEAVNT